MADDGLSEFDNPRMRRIASGGADGGDWSRDLGEFDDQPLLRDEAFNKHSHNAKTGWRHVSPLANGHNDVGVDGIHVKLVRGLPPERDIARVLSRAMNATTGFDVLAIDTPLNVNDEEWRDLLRGGLQAVMEAFVIVFEVSGVSRACTHQLVRTRKAAFHQQSQRATSYVRPSLGDDGSSEPLGANVRVPESVWRTMQNPNEELNMQDDLSWAWHQALMWSRRAYRLACEMDVSYQDARYILPEGTENYIMCEYNWREFLAVYDYRACSMFNWEIVHVVRQMGALLIEQSPWIVGTGGEPRISCERTTMALDGGPGKHTCTFQGWERVEDQCGFSWAREANRTFRPKRTI
jgi:thymidylate synthase (FAD)